ncbi:hypothetical protein B0G84_3650 [Paraburkholderia sp. BL8N3]|nr:hypothetical protein B0G84_3650 [Paraburkholderia sp. BL8N3]
MSYIRHKILLTLPPANPTLLVEQGFAGHCRVEGNVGPKRLERFYNRRPAHYTAWQALSLSPNGFRFARRCLYRLATSRATSKRQAAARAGAAARCGSRARKKIHGMAVA